MEIRITIEAIMTVPDGTELPEDGREFRLPTGGWVKPYIVLEKDDETDLSFAEAQALGCDVHETDIEWVEV